MTDIENTTGATDKRLLTIDERIEAMEALLPMRGSPGTSITRVFAPVQGVEWCLALGGIQMPKTFFRGPTIENVVTQGEAAIANMKNGRLETDWDKLNDMLCGDVEQHRGRVRKTPAKASKAATKS